LAHFEHAIFGTIIRLRQTLLIACASFQSHKLPRRPPDQPMQIRGAERSLRCRMLELNVLGWLLFPEQRAVEIWRASGAGIEPGPQRLEVATRLEGGTLFPGLVLDLEEIWAI
jgi:hypothetical protein